LLTSVNWLLDSTSGVVAAESRLILNKPEKTVFEVEAVKVDEFIVALVAEVAEISRSEVVLVRSLLVMVWPTTEVGEVELELLDEEERVREEPLVVELSTLEDVFVTLLLISV
jgi:hypothetical protein